MAWLTPGLPRLLARGWPALPKIPVSRQESQRLDLARPDHGEVTLVERRDLSDAKALRESDDGGIGRPQRQVAVLQDEFGHPADVLSSQINKGEVAICHRLEETRFDSRAPFAIEHVSNFGHHRGWDDKWLSRHVRAGEELSARVMVPLVGDGREGLALGLRR